MKIYTKEIFIDTEDFLTFFIFSHFTYFQLNKGLLPYLEKLVSLEDKLVNLKQEPNVTLYFWPLGINENREPDLLIQIINGEYYDFLFEIKTGASPSNNEIEISTDNNGNEIVRGYQLNDQHRDFMNFGKYETYENINDFARNKNIILKSKIENRYHIYLTHHDKANKPIEDIEVNFNKYEKKSKILWSNWQFLHSFLENLKNNVNSYEKTIINVMQDILYGKGFYEFNGFNHKLYYDIKIEPNSAFFWSCK